MVSKLCVSYFLIKFVCHWDHCVQRLNLFYSLECIVIDPQMGHIINLFLSSLIVRQIFLAAFSSEMKASTSAFLVRPTTSISSTKASSWIVPLVFKSESLTVFLPKPSYTRNTRVSLLVLVLSLNWNGPSNATQLWFYI